MRILFISILAMAPLSAHAGEPPESFNYASQVGVAEVNVAAYGCLTIVNDTLREGETIRLIAPGAPQTVFETAIRKKLAFNCSRTVDFPQGASFYSFRAGNEAMDPSVAIVRFSGDLRVVDGRVRADLNGDRVPESFRSCTSSEGLHLTVWSGEPLTTERLWHRYVYLGYDIEPTCTPPDYDER